ncbi:MULTISPECIES: hypothetical protein [Caballeronia]|uniref:Uncharacterized protein n=1 Tax=Caballeronia zhejiangensis TaxID=871203 RepID=A0A656QAI6_9BURK|nr:MULTISPECIES: hypothetical protein [Caballeronia]EKS72051.1 hypothetical protein BURK_009471 [Burkholderia sp. SJ98]KDR26173.1 hypothetical protein BG60_23870 [Caballeronia zhejiangensis]
MTRPLFIRLADVIAFLVVTYLIASIATKMLGQIASWPDPGRWIAIFVVGALAIACAIKIKPISRCFVDLIHLPFDRSKE